MQLTSYWLDSTPPFSGARGGDVEGSFDVAVIGGGFTGLSSALALARQGATVTVLEAGRVIGEASGRNGGQCNTGTLQDYAGLVDRYGREAASSYYQAFNRAVDSVERLVADEQIECGFRRSGKLKLAAKPGHVAKLARTYEALRVEVEPDVKLLSAQELGDEIGSGVFYGGLLQPGSAQLHVGRFGVGLAGAASTAGAAIYEKAAVTGVRRAPAGNWHLSTTRGSLRAGQVLVATGGSGPGPFGWYRRRIVPVGSFIIVTEPLDPALLQRLLPGDRSYVTTKNIGNYFRATPDNRLLFGGRARFAVSNPKSDRKSGEILRAALARIFPDLAAVGIDYCWGGTVDMSADRLPHAGEHDGLFYAMGYSGHGVQMSVHMGQVMADLMQGKSAANPWADLSWPPVPGHFGKPWFLPAVGLYYRALDALQ